MVKDNAIAISRAIAIICMVAGHSWIDSPIEKVVNLFDMSLFYFASGYCFNLKYLSTPIAFLKKRITGLWYPYVTWGVISVLLHNLFLGIGIYSVDSLGNSIPPWSVTQIIKRLLGCLVFGEGPDGFLGGYWFLKDMFFAVLLAYVTIALVKGVCKKVVIGGGILLALSIIKLYSNITIPYFHTSTLLSASVFIVGYIIKQQDYVMNFARSRYRYMLLLLTIIGIAYIRFPLSMSQLYIETGNVYSIVPFFLYSTIFSLAILSVLSKYRNLYKESILIRIAIYIGNNSLTILTFHMLAFKSVNYLLYKCYSLEFYTIGLFPTNLDYAAYGWWMVYTIVGVSAPIICKYLLEKIVNSMSYV